MVKYWQLSFGLAFFTCLACLNFGKNIELSGAAFDTTKLDEITTLTGIRFPAGSDGLEYFYLGDTIDPSIQAKVEIPAGERDEFLENAIFEPANQKAAPVSGPKSWWAPGLLKGAIHGESDLKPGQNVAVSFGEVDGRFFAYVTWRTF